jgi:hypothetical protein
MSTQAIPSPWIISPRNDLIFFSGSAILGYALIAAAFMGGGLPGSFLLLYAFAIDGPHVFSTLTRALFDREERFRLRRLWLLVFPLCVLGIFFAAVFLGSDIAFIIIAGLSQYHISKQHMGFVMIYKRKARETTDYRVDKYFTLTSLMIPLAYYLSTLLMVRRIPLAAFLLPAILLALWYTWHQMQRKALNKPKLLLLVAFIPLQWLAWSFAATDPHSMIRLVAAGVALNVGHSFQYLRLMYFHNYNRYAERPGLLGLVSGKPIYFLAAVMILALPNFLSFRLDAKYLSAFVVGMLLFHFVLDSKIWRIRGNKELAQALNL